jgi:hypothetical protein
VYHEHCKTGNYEIIIFLEKEHSLCVKIAVLEKMNLQVTVQNVDRKCETYAETEEIVPLQGSDGKIEQSDKCRT